MTNMVWIREECSGRRLGSPSTKKRGLATTRLRRKRGGAYEKAANETCHHEPHTSPTPSHVSGRRFRPALGRQYLVSTLACKYPGTVHGRINDTLSVHRIYVCFVLSDHGTRTTDLGFIDFNRAIRSTQSNVLCTVRVHSKAKGIAGNFG